MIRRNAIKKGIKAPVANLTDPGFREVMFGPLSRSKKLTRTDEDIRVAVNLWCTNRDAAEKQIEIITEYRDHFTQGVIHCFTGDKKTLYRYLDLDLYIGITGWVCDPKRGQELRKSVADIPLIRLMIETDAPYLVPKNMPNPPKNRRNEPAFLGFVIEGIKSQRSETLEAIAQATTANAKQFFNI